VGLFSTISTKRGRTMLVKFAGEIVALALDAGTGTIGYRW
jgi:hypothetical protein